MLKGLSHYLFSSLFLMLWKIIHFFYKLCLVPENFEEKYDEKKSERKKKPSKIKNQFKINKLFLYTSLNSFLLILFYYTRIK